MRLNDVHLGAHDYVRKFEIVYPFAFIISVGRNGKRQNRFAYDRRSSRAIIYLSWLCLTARSAIRWSSKLFIAGLFLPLKVASKPAEEEEGEAEEEEEE